eukprot:scaffold1864_cov106-Isochrysis_galbana.AAC.4
MRDHSFQAAVFGSAKVVGCLKRVRCGMASAKAASQRARPDLAAASSHRAVSKCDVAGSSAADTSRPAQQAPHPVTSRDCGAERRLPNFSEMGSLLNRSKRPVAPTTCSGAPGEKDASHKGTRQARPPIGLAAAATVAGGEACANAAPTPH